MTDFFSFFKNKKLKISTIMFLILFSFLITNYIGYTYLLNNIEQKYIKNEDITFYKIHKESSNLLNYLLNNFSKEKANIIKKHKIVLNYFNTNPYNINLKEIHHQINMNNDDIFYDIFITDENLNIVNSTLKSDIGLNLGFAKNTFEKHRKENLIGLSAPIFKIDINEFYSFTDSYLPKCNCILQIGYRYKNTKEQLKLIQKLIDKDPSIESANAFLIFKDGYIGDFIFKKFKTKKINEEEINNRIRNGKKLLNKIKDYDLITEEYLIDNTHYKDLYFIQNSPFYDDAKILYSISFNQQSLNDEISKVNRVFIFLTLSFLLTIYFLIKIRDKEISLTNIDTFIKYSVHEIKTPLSIISINNQLRQKIIGNDKYSEKINSAIKTLNHSYEDMSFLISQNHISYKKESINISDFLKQRISYFSSVIKTQGRKINIAINNDLYFNISEVELTRLIDNNISNAIKYSNINSEIQIKLKNNCLLFKTEGKEIIDTEKIFDKYQRFETKQGGHGLGLNLVKNIADKYNIKIDVISKNNTNTFRYTFIDT